MTTALPKLLFVENREKTYFWRLVAKRLQADGFAVGWIVQNPIFGRALPGKIYSLELPGKNAGSDHERQISPLLKTDRGKRFFGNGDSHYAHYYMVIEEAIKDFQPDFVIGESTLFHELIAADVTEAMGAIYLHPTGERYPSGRFVIFRGTTQQVFRGSQSPMCEAAALSLATQIGQGSKGPDYMRKTGRLANLIQKWRWVRTRLRVWGGRLLGERFNTPPLTRKLALMRQTKRNIARWRAAATTPDPNEPLPLLYPLQLQPEANIDVWGFAYHNQLALVQRLCASIPPDRKLALKANPKTYMEMSDAMLDHAIKSDKILLLPIEMTMPEAHAICEGAITVTGTIGFEAVCGRGRCLSLGHPILDAHFADFSADSPETAVAKLLADPVSGKGDPKLGSHLIDLFHRRSYAGRISDPVSDPTCLNAANIAMVTDALVSALFGDYSRA